MTKESKRKLLFITVILAMLLISSAYAILVPNAHASPTTLQQNGVSILSNVVGLDLAKYTLTSNIYPQNASFIGVVPQESIEYNLTSQGSGLDVLCTFANGNLQMLQVLDSVGSPILAKPETAGAVGVAKNFLSNYQTYTAGSIYGQLKSTLNNVDASKNLTQTSGNTKLEVSAISNGYTSYKWTYTINGIIAPTKFVALGFKNNSLSYFVDNWQLFTIGSTTATLSQNQAETIALNTAKAHSWSVPLDNGTFAANNFNESNVAFAALLFDHSDYKDATHSGNPLTLYPVWRVGVQLNKWYGDLYGIEVDMYADTGQVITAQEALSTLHPQAGNTQISDLNPTQPVNGQASVAAETNPTLMLWLLLSTSAGIIGTASVWMIKKRSQSYELPQWLTINKTKCRVHFGNLLKRHNPITVGTLICIIVLPSLMFFTSIPTVKATLHTRTAIIWGSESIGQLYGQPGPSYNYWRKTIDEIMRQKSVADGVGYYFSSAESDWGGINGGSINQQGDPGSRRDNILGDLYYLKNNNAANVAVVDFDHGVGTASYSPDPGVFHYMFEDEVGTCLGNYGNWSPAPMNAVYDNDVYWRVNQGEVTFAFINTCFSADYNNGYYDGPLGVQNPYHPLDGQAYPYIYQGALPGGYYRGMPYAFTHRLIGSQMNSNGYDNPDSVSQVYIGFPIGAPSLYQWIPNPNVAGHKYSDWVYDFFYALTIGHMTVHNALDSASIQLWGTYFSGSCLYQYGSGFKPYWYIQGGGTNWPMCWMAVYGNGNFKPSPQVYATLTVNAGGFYQPYHYVYPHVYVDGIDVGIANYVSTHVSLAYHTVRLDDPTWDSNQNCYASWMGMLDQNGNGHNNGESIPIYTDTQLYNYYYP